MSPGVFDKMMLDLAINSKTAMPMPRGLGGYELHLQGMVRLDPRQKGTGVKSWYAQLIDRNKYRPGQGKR